MRTTDQITSVSEELRLGNTDQAIHLLGSAWRGIGKRPPDAATSRQTAANLLYCGILTSRLGAESRVKGAQGAARDLLSESFRLFSRLRDQQRLKARIELALTYWRSGEINEALAYISDIHPADPVLKFEATLMRALLETELGRHDQALSALESAQDNADSMPLVLQAQFHQERAVALRNLPSTDNLDRSLIEYEAALIFYEEAACKKGESIVLNNLASIYRDFGQYQRAHSYAERSIRLSYLLRNQFRIAEAEDQRALIFFAEGNYSEAARLSQRAVANLRESDQQRMLGNVLLTLGRSLARLKKFDAAIEELERAEVVFTELDDHLGQADVCLTMLEELRLPVPAALTLLLRATHLSANTHLTSRLSQTTRQVAIQLISENTTYKEVDAHADKIKAKLISRTLAKHGGANTRGAIAQAARELGIHHTSLLAFLDHHDHVQRKKRPRSCITAIPRQKKLV